MAINDKNSAAHLLALEVLVYGDKLGNLKAPSQTQERKIHAAGNTFLLLPPPCGQNP